MLPGVTIFVLNSVMYLLAVATILWGLRLFKIYLAFLGFCLGAVVGAVIGTVAASLDQASISGGGI